MAERAPGSTAFPVARIKRLIKEDKEIAMISSEATFCIAVATELFLEHFIKESHMNVKKDKRKTVFYRDMADVVQDNASFEFLSDVIPTTMTLKAAVEKRKRALAEEAPTKKQKTVSKSTSEPQDDTKPVETSVEKDQ
ncbi:histone-fold-containing protein [Sporodiniella umbellata]|nr:histone-fold-containing protein [Sporodiniella umbellata]